jgi:hypothetical protein
MAARIIYLIIVLLSVLWLPSWLPIIFGLVGMAYYHNFYEVIVPAFMFDIIYSAPGVTPVHFPLMFSVLGIAAVYLAEDFKTRLMVSRFQ